MKGIDEKQAEFRPAAGQIPKPLALPAEQPIPYVLTDKARKYVRARLDRAVRQ